MGWYEAVKDALSAAQKADNVELIKQILEVQKELQEMQQQNFELKQENTKLKELLETKVKMKYSFEKNYYFTQDEKGEIDGIFCPRCWDDKNKQVRLAKDDLDLICNVCGIRIG